MFSGLTETHETTELVETRPVGWGNVLRNIFPWYPLPLQLSSAVLPDVQPEQLAVEITVNRIFRFLSILGLGFWGGWSLIPDERRVPTTMTWVVFIVVMTDWSFYITFTIKLYQLIFCAPL
jgi:hypothetical protein